MAKWQLRTYVRGTVNAWIALNSRSGNMIKVQIRALAMLLLTCVPVFGQVSTNSFFNWETPPVHPVALSPDGTKLVVCNLPDNRLEVFDLSSGTPSNVGSVSVGLDPVSARFHTSDEVWVVNFISDSVSIVSLSQMQVVATLDTRNEPSDLVFAGSPPRAFVSCAQPNLIQVFDPGTRSVITNLTIDGNRPKAMATSPDGNTVYAAIFESGNGSTIIGAGVNLGLPPPTPVDFPSGPHGGLNPPPNQGTNFYPPLNPQIPATNLPPRVGLIVKKNPAGRWMDDSAGDWTEYIGGSNSIFSGRPLGWDLPDHDLAMVNATNYGITYATGLMNICMDVAVNPASGRITVIGTESLNEIRYEPVLKGVFVRVELATVDPVQLTNRVVDLNRHLDYQTRTLSEQERAKSIGDPRGIVWSSDGSRGYVTGMGSDNLIVIDANGQRQPTNSLLSLGKGPTGLALDEARRQLYVWNRFDNSLTVVNTDSQTVTKTIPLFDPTPTVIKIGRPHLYDTHRTSGLGQAACGSCHVDSRFDRLAWDLGDMTGVMKGLTNANFGRNTPGVTNSFHPMKGPMVTQTLQDIIGHEPFHWRGDREGLEQFNVTFTNLQAAATALSDAELQEFKNFLATVRFPPNPFRTISNTLPASLALPGMAALGHGVLSKGAPLPNGNALNGQTLFRSTASTGCAACHTLPGGFGTDLRWTGSSWVPLALGPNGEHHAAYIVLERSSQLPFKIQSLRNLYDKFGLDFTKSSNRAGFGLFHDGSVDTPARFVQDGFDIRSDQDTADLVAFLFAFTGSDLTPGSTTDPNHPPGLPSKDTHAAVGRQVTISNSAAAPLVDVFLSIATPLTSRVDIIAKGFKNSLPRGWFFNRTNGLFQSDRITETISPAGLRALATGTNPLTYTVVPRESGKRMGIDRDEDGYLDRDELDFGSDPANALSLATNRPPVLTPMTNQLVFVGQAIAFSATATDPDIPRQNLQFSLGGTPPPGASINPTNGAFVWLPAPDQFPSTNTITIVVTDDGSPPRADAKSFTATVLGLRLEPPVPTPDGRTLIWNVPSGRNFRVEFKTNLDDANWRPLTDVISATNGTLVVPDPAPDPQRFYRLLLLP